MYNINLKETFICTYSQSPNTRQVCKELFSGLREKEEMWQADICTRDNETLSPIMESLAGIRSRSTWIRVNILRDYINWCAEKGVPGANKHVNDIEVSGHEQMRSKTIPNPLALAKYLDIIFRLVSDNTVDCVYRSFCWLAYAGVPENDLTNLTADNLDFFNMVVRIDDVEYPIYREAVPALRICATATEFDYHHPNYKKPIVKPRVPGNLLLRGFNPPSLHIFRNTLTKKTDVAIMEGKTNIRLSYFRLWLSGLFHTKHMEEWATGEIPSFEGIASPSKGNAPSNENYRDNAALANTYLEDYNRWKLSWRSNH